MTATGGPRSIRPCAALLALGSRFSTFDAAREAAGRGLLERFTASRQARVGHEVFVGVELLLALARPDAGGGAIRQIGPALLVVLEVGEHDLVQHLLVHGRI